MIAKNDAMDDAFEKHKSKSLKNQLANLLEWHVCHHKLMMNIMMMYGRREDEINFCTNRIRFRCRENYADEA